MPYAKVVDQIKKQKKTIMVYVSENDHYLSPNDLCVPLFNYMNMIVNRLVPILKVCLQYIL